MNTTTNKPQSPQVVTGSVARSVQNERRDSTEVFANSTDLFPVRRSTFNGFEVCYLLQGGNGPCPLLAICNVLLLRGAIRLPEDCETVSFAYLLDRLANLMIDKNNTVDADETLRSTLDKSVGLLGGLNKGMDVDIRFASVEGFEYSPEMSIFDLLDVRVYHGWIVSEDDLSAFPYVSQITYNQAVEKVAAYEEIKTKALESPEGFETAIDTKKDIIAEGEAIAKWLEATSNQLTSDGLIQLHSSIQENDVAVFFRNNHFSVIHKRQSFLFALVTDIGFRRTNVMWESLDQLDGDTLYLDSSFRPAASQGGLFSAPPPRSPPRATPTVVPAKNVKVVVPGGKKKKNKKCTIM
jgi:hypothetical protein